MRRAIRAGIAAAIALAAPACGPDALPPESEVVLGVDTDAILPPGPGERASDPALFDRLRIEIFAPGATSPCARCTREFGIDHATVWAGRASVGVVVERGASGYRARVRIYRSTGSDVVAPRPTSTLEAVVALPVAHDGEVVGAHVVLPTSSLGAPQGTLDAPIAAEKGPAKGKLAGTFASAQRRDCAGAPQGDEVCVPGGAYWMGNPDFDEPSEHLVVVSPFFVQTSEVTVAAYRASSVPKIETVVPRSTSASTCTYSAEPGPFDGYPVNCVTRSGATQFCEARGGSLISEAQFEFIASARRSAHHVWGGDDAKCEDAVYARLDDPKLPTAYGECKALGVGPQPVGSGARDHLAVGDRDVTDLEGSLTEWVADVWQKEGEPCWSAALLVDPLCTTPSTMEPGVIDLRGGSWKDPGVVLGAAIRSKLPTTSKNPARPEIGFRCVRPG